MDRYKGSERALKIAAAQQCKDNGTVIKQDFVAIATSASTNITPVNNAAEVVRHCFLERAAADRHVLRTGFDILLDTVELIERITEQKVTNNGHQNDKRKSLNKVAELAKGHQFKETSKSVILCHISGDTHVYAGASDGDSGIINELGDSFYDLNIVERRPTVESSRVSSANSNVKETLDAYTSTANNRYVAQGFTILSDDSNHRNKGGSETSNSEDTAAPKNLNLQALCAMSGQPLLVGCENPFEAYYENFNQTSALNKENNVTHYVGGMYPPFHTYYSKGGAGKENVMPMISQNFLRRIHCEQGPKLADNLLKQCKEGEPFAFVAKTLSNEHTAKDVVFINESALRFQVSPATSPIEHIAFIGKKPKVYKCTTYTARVHPNMSIHQRRLCYSLLTSDVEQGKLVSKLLLKLMRYEYALKNAASEWRSHNEEISKAISNIQWGCLWQNWNFFSGDLITEADLQQLPEKLKQLEEEDVDESLTTLRSVCRQFIETVNMEIKKYERGELQVVDLVSKIVSMYTNDVVAAFETCYEEIRNHVYLDLRANSKTFPQMLANILDSSHAGNRITNVDTHNAPIEYKDPSEILQLRAELLPKHQPDAIDPSTLTSLDDIIGKGLMEHPGLSGEPFMGYFTANQVLDMNTKQSYITSTAVDLYKKCADYHKKNKFALDKSKSAKALVVLNSLITLLKNNEKRFGRAKDLRDFLSVSNNIPETFATWTLGLFYERNATDEFFINAKGLQKLMCYVLWLCIYLVGGKYSYNFATLLNVDLKSKRMLHTVFQKCIPIAGLVSSGATKSSIYTIEVPLPKISQTATNTNGSLHASKYENIDPSTISAKEKRKIRDLILEGEHVKLIEQVLKKVPMDVILKPKQHPRLAPTSRLPKLVQKETSAGPHDIEEEIDAFDGEKDVEEPTHINKIRSSTFVLHRGEVHLVLASQHVSQARSRGHYKVKLRNLTNNKEISHSFSDGTKLSVVTPNKVSCIYKGTDERSGDHIFQNEKGDMRLPKGSQLQALKYMKPELKVTISTWKGEIIGLFVPHQIQYKVVHINIGNYAATLENGLVILVPTYVKPGDCIDVNTAKCEFLRRSVIG
ncbi:elongation factor P [Babesia ovis]|uniref:Elongation factor P n=1 Tax=Babesia ovis TaxID=5869 RepID=A0A9W5TAD7_BABOV|nr:elongation factor P [Babesia ovis]